MGSGDVKINKNIDIDTKLQHAHLVNRFSKYKTVMLLGLACAIVVTILFGICVRTGGTYIYDAVWGHTTISDQPELMQSLQHAQAQGVLLGVHGFEHENEFELTPAQAKLNAEKGEAIFAEAGLVPDLFILPYVITDAPDYTAVTNAINNTGTPVNVDAYMHHPIVEYTWMWRNMTTSTDSRYQIAYDDIRSRRPNTIMLHAQDWNPYTEKILMDYLTTTNATNITIRIDDISTATSADAIYSMTKFRDCNAVGTLIFAIIPSTPITYASNNPIILGMKCNDILNVCLIFFVLTMQLPVLFFMCWKLSAKIMMRKTDERDSASTDIEYPELVSLIVPAYNEEKSIGRCIESLLNQVYTGKTEIIVVNDGSKDRTAEIAAGYPVKLLDLKKNRGKANALNEAIAIAKGSILVFTDGDSYVEKNAVSRIVQHFATHSDISMIAGNVLINKSTKGIIARALTYCQMIEYRLDQDIRRYLQGLNGQVIICPGALTAVRREVYNVTKYSDRTVVEDADFSFTVLSKSLKAARIEDANVYTNAPDTITAWYKQRTRWWFGFLQVCRIHREWSATNSWVIYGYLSHIVCIVKIISLVAIPYILMQYDSPALILIHSLIYGGIAALLYMLCIAIFFTKDLEPLVMIIPYLMIYSFATTFIVGYIYLCHVCGLGMAIKFGSRVIIAN
jgi:cellulose synthase/poly-beta-1,6-N-acetylglucosamine synthase-like glycosyltransferase